MSTNENEEGMTTDELLEMVNQEEEFRQMVTQLLSADSVDVFDRMSDITNENHPHSMKQFIGDLRSIYEEEPLRIIVKMLLQEYFTVPQMRGLNLLLASHIRHLKRVQEVNKIILKDARSTIEHYLPAFENLVHFLEEAHGDESDYSNELADGLNQEFIADLIDALQNDERVDREFLIQICNDKEFRDTIKESVDKYPAVVSYIFGLANQLMEAKDQLEEIEINEMLHDIEGHEEW